MIRLDKITTRAGDDGTTGLGDGTRVNKASLRIEAIGVVDEANATIGLLRLHTASHTNLDAMLDRIQNDLFDIGADLAVPGEAGARLRLAAEQVVRLDIEIAGMNAELPPLRSFVLPGGSVESAHAHLVRTTARRAERALVALAGAEAINPALGQYLNRLSDHLFVLGRVLNAGHDVLWKPGGSRQT